ncbi:hypothetical protein J3E69DRAFT_251726 [Trichoderma sp. SZMC 28015]
MPCVLSILYCQPCLLTCVPPDRRVARPWYYYWIPTECGIAKRGPVCGRYISRTPPPSEREENGP